MANPLAGLEKDWDKGLYDEHTPRFQNVMILEGRWEGQENREGLDFPVNFVANPSLFLIREAWHQGLDLEAEADGFGAGNGTMGGDWSGIRDSSPRAIDKMLTKALNHLFGGHTS